MEKIYINPAFFALHVKKKNQPKIKQDMYKHMQGGMEELRESWNLPFPVLDHNYSINCKHVRASASHFTQGNFRQTILSIF